jgi:hypothetical protein
MRRICALLQVQAVRSASVSEAAQRAMVGNRSAAVRAQRVQSHMQPMAGWRHQSVTARGSRCPPIAFAYAGRYPIVTGQVINHVAIASVAELGETRTWSEPQRSRAIDGHFEHHHCPSVERCKRQNRSAKQLSHRCCSGDVISLSTSRPRPRTTEPRRLIDPSPASTATSSALNYAMEPKPSRMRTESSSLFVQHRITNR